MKAIAMCRVSTQKQDEGKRQLFQIRNYCAEKGYVLIEDKTISEIVSGASLERTGLTELMQLTKADADIIIVSEASRLTRRNDDDFMNLYTIVKAIQNTGLDLFILGSGKEYKADVKLTLIDVIQLVIESDANAKEREKIKIRMVSGKEKKLAAGGYTGHTMPFGYYNKYKGEGKIVKPDYFQINEEEAVIVRTLFDLVANQGYSVNKATIYLNNVLGLKCTEATTLKRLKSRVYCDGSYMNMGKAIPAPAIISTELFNQAQNNINVNHLFISKGNKFFNQLKGIGKCSCGCSLYQRNNKGTSLIYCCTSKTRLLQTKCTNAGINSKFLNNIVWNITKNYINIDDFKAKTEVEKQLIAIEIKAIERRKAALLADKAEQSINIDNLVENIVTANKSIQPILNKKLAELVAAAAAIEKSIEKINIEATKVQSKLKDLSVNLLPAFVDNITEQEKNEIFLKYIDTVVYHSIDICKGFITILYKNKVEIIVIANNRPYQAYVLPLSFRFNSTNRTVFEVKEFESEKANLLYLINKSNEPEDLGENRNLQFIYSNTIESTYNEMKANYPMNDYLMKL